MTELCLVGEAYGENEDRHNFPFVGKSGAELYRMLSDAGFQLKTFEFYPGAMKMKLLWKESGIHLTNVFTERPPDNKLEEFLDRKSALGVCKDLPAVKPGLYLKSSKLHHLERLHAELEELKPNLTVALGNTPCWALLQVTKISELRGNVFQAPWGKVLPTFHPAHVLRSYENRVVVVTDLMKARVEMTSKEFNRKRREIWTEPDISDLHLWWEEHGSKSELLSIDIETEKCRQISEIGLASDSTHALHIPFIVDRTKSYWPDIETEMAAWKFIRMVMNSEIPKVGQNFIYDIQYLWKIMGIPVHNFVHDTMLLHHALYPGMRKSLGFLGSIYCNEPAWKGLRREGNKDDE